jgi:putative FmdB family regulatory protein
VPIYEYRCDDCGATFEVFQKFSDAPVAKCERCGGPVRKVLHPVAVHFKGSGFYTTDYGRKSSHRGPGDKAETGEEAATAAAGDAGSGTSGAGVTDVNGEGQGSGGKGERSRGEKAVAGTARAGSGQG